MKKVLLIAPIDTEFHGSFGYNNASGSLFKLLTILKNSGDIELDVLNADKLMDTKVTLKEYHVGIVLGNPNSFNNPTIIAIYSRIMSLCMERYLYLFWETKPLPEEWTIFSSNLFTGFIAPSNFILEQLISIDKKGFYLPISLDFSKYNLIDINKKKNSNQFKVLYIGQNTKRKGLEDALIGFIRSFSDQSECTLIIKSFQMSSNEDTTEQTINKMVDLNSTGNLKCKIYMLERVLEAEELSILYKDCDLLLFPSRGEGFGLPLLEAGLIGVPSLYVPWSSSIEVAESSYNTPIDYNVDEAYSMFQYGYNYNTFYAVPLITSIMEGLNKYYQLWKDSIEDYYKGAKENRELMEARFNEDICVEYMKTILNLI